MIHISITTSKKQAKQIFPTSVQAPLGEQTCYYQIFQDGKPLSGLHFATKREARKALRALPEALIAQSYGWYRVEVRRNGAVGNILGIRKHFDDGAAIESTFMVRKVSASTTLKYR